VRATLAEVFKANVAATIRRIVITTPKTVIVFDNLLPKDSDMQPAHILFHSTATDQKARHDLFPEKLIKPWQ
jgi:hypothetical protein